MNFETAAWIVTWAAIAILALAMAGLLRQVHTLAHRLAPREERVGPTIGARAPLPTRASEVPSSSAILLFVDDECLSCQQLLPVFDAAAARDSREVSYAAVYRASPGRYEPRTIATYAHQNAVHERFGIVVRPFAVAIDHASIVVDARPVGSGEQLETFLEKARAQI